MRGVGFQFFLDKSLLIAGSRCKNTIKEEVQANGEGEGGGCVEWGKK